MKKYFDINKTYSLYYIYCINLLLFIFNCISNFIMGDLQRFWFISLILIILSIFETLLTLLDKNLNPKYLSIKDTIEIILKSIAATIISVGSIIFIIALFIK